MKGKQWIKGCLPAPLKQWLKALIQGSQDLPLSSPIKQYFEDGRVPWSVGYTEYKFQQIEQAINTSGLLNCFYERQILPPGYGYRLDERIVEYPWVFSRSADWGLRILDAGSTLNKPLLLDHPSLRSKEILICNLAQDWNANRPNVTYLTGDLRNLEVPQESMDIVVCISTLEHIGLDNTMLYSTERRFQEDRPSDYKIALREFRRILVNGGRLLLTIPFGKAKNHGWLQQFDQLGVQKIIEEFGGQAIDVSYFQYKPTGWIRSSAEKCQDCEYFDIHAKKHCDPDYAAAARAVVCIDLMRKN